ncbi:MAG: alpha/beta hydrolase [Chitinophagaceae bacterium]
MKQELKTVYFISGLGADSRAFSYLDLSFCNPVYLPWQIPEKNESIENYALRYKSLITGTRPILIGLSFGGMLAMEIAKYIQFSKIIIISSAKTRKELPFYLRAMKYIPIHRLIKPQNLKQLNNLAYKFLRVHLRKDKVVCMQMIRESDNRLVSWTIDSIVNWKNNLVALNTIHIHGSHDILLPHFFVKADHKIAKGRHMIPMIEPEKISALLKQIILNA